jgi:hypothetical protein
MSAIRSFAKSCIVGLLGSEVKPRRIVGGLASGYRIYVSPAGQLGYLLGTDEPHLQRAIREYVAQGDTVYDIGANLGYVSLSLAKRVGPNGRVIVINAELHKKDNLESCRRRTRAMVCRSVAIDQGLCRSRRTRRSPRAELGRHFGDG